jgi:hypothetical protein
MKIDNYIIQSSPGFLTDGDRSRRGPLSNYRGDLSGVIEKNKLQIDALRHPQIQAEPVYRNNFYAPPVYDLPTKINQVSTYNKGLPSTYNQQYRADLQFGRPVNKLSKDTSYDILNINKPLTYPEDTFIPLKTLNRETPTFKVPKNTAPLSDGVESLVVRYNQNINNYVQSITNKTGFNHDFTQMITNETFLLNRQHFSDYKKFWTKIFASTNGNILFYTYGNPTLLAYLSFYPELNHKKQTIYYYDKTDITQNVQEELFGTRFSEALYTSKYNTVIADITLESKTSADDLLDVFSREEKLYIITTRQMYNDPEDKRTPKPLETDATDEHQPAERRYSDEHRPAEYTDEYTDENTHYPINFDEYKPDAYPTGDSSDPAEAAPINPDTHSAIFQSSHDLSDYPGDSEYTDEQKQELLNYGSIDPLASQLPYMPPTTEEQADTQQVISENIQQTPNYQQELNQLNLAKQEEESRENARELVGQFAEKAVDDILNEAMGNQLPNEEAPQIMNEVDQETPQVDEFLEPNSKNLDPEEAANDDFNANINLFRTTKNSFNESFLNQIINLNDQHGINLLGVDGFVNTLKDLIINNTLESATDYVIETAKNLVDNNGETAIATATPVVDVDQTPESTVPPELTVDAVAVEKELTDLDIKLNTMDHEQLLHKAKNLYYDIPKHFKPKLEKPLADMDDSELKSIIKECAIIVAERNAKAKPQLVEMTDDDVLNELVADSLHSTGTYEHAIEEDKELTEKEKIALRKFMSKFYKENIEFEKPHVNSSSDLSTTGYYMIGKKFYTIAGNDKDKHFINVEGERIDFTKVRYGIKGSDKYPQVFKLKNMEVADQPKTPVISVAKRSDIFPNWYNAAEYAIKHRLYKQLPKATGKLNKKELDLFMGVWNRYNTTGSGYHKARLHRMHLLGGKIIKNGNRIYHLLPYDPRTKNKRKYPVGVGLQKYGGKLGGAIEKFQKKRQLQDRGQMVVLNGFVSNVFEL